MRNKFEQIKDVIRTCDVLLISESKLDHTFPAGQFRLDGFHTPFRRDRDSFGGGLILFVNDDIICNRVDLQNEELSPDLELLGVELNLRKQKWLLLGCYRPPSQSVELFCNEVRTVISDLNYENIILLGDFNADESVSKMKLFSTECNLKNLIKEPTCFKSQTAPTCIDHIWVSDSKRFHHTNVLDFDYSDFHKLTVTFLNVSLPKKEPRTINYRCYKNFNEATFKNELNDIITANPAPDFETFDAEIKTLINKHVPLKTKIVRSNNAPFMTKRVRKEIMLRSKCKNVYSKNPTALNWNNYRWQRNRCVKLVRNAKRLYYSRLNLNLLSDNRKFWKAVKPVFSEKSVKDSVKSLVENGDVIRDKSGIANLMNDHYINITKNLNINDIPKKTQNSDTDSIDGIVGTFENHPSIVRIRNRFSNVSKMNFVSPGSDIMIGYISRLKTNKAGPEGDIPAKLVKNNRDIFGPVLDSIFSKSLQEKSFPGPMKFADISPLFKEGSRFAKANYRPISKLPCLSKVFEMAMYDQIQGHMSDFLSPLLSGFRKGYSSQHALMQMLNSWQKSLDNKKHVSALLMDLSKAFDCVDHSLLIAKLHAYGLSNDALEFVKNYLNGRFQRVGVDKCFSTWMEIFTGVPQGSILGPLLFNIYINDLMFLFEASDVSICNYADDNTIYAAGDNFSEVKTSLERAFIVVSNWFSENGLQLNASKCKFLCLGRNSCDDPLELVLGSTRVKESDSVKLLGIILDKMLSFEEHVSMLCKKANAKISALRRIASFFSQEQKKVLANSFIFSNFSYCPLIWGFSSRKNLNMIDRIREKAFCLFSSDSPESTIHDRFCCILLQEVFKTLNGLNPTYMNDVFNFQNRSYHLRSFSSLIRESNHTSKFGLKSISNIAAQLWSTVPASLKAEATLNGFKLGLTGPDKFSCSCRLCARYIPHVGFIT